VTGRVAWLLPALPAAAALVLVTTGGRFRRSGAAVAVGATAAALAVALTLGYPQHLVQVSTPLVPGIGSFLAFGYDGLAGVLAVVVCCVALAVQVYSVGYQRHDERYETYAGLVSLFTAAMLLVVTAGDLLVLLVGWEVMGICSYFLIGHDREEKVATDAAISAFLTTRFADLFFTAGIFVLGLGAGSFRIDDVVAAAAPGGHLSHLALVVGGVLLLGGCIGKSAQVPLQTWLPDAMAGPTPVSALIHAATMVAAGVYVVARVYPVVAGSAVTLDVLAVVAAVTMLLGAVCALAQDDLKRVLAWSTVSQLAYMYGALAVGGYTAGVFHLMTHAAFKALLFLAAGSVIHAVGSNSMGDMGGLRRPLPLTFLTMTVGLGALAGLPPFAGFVSKDAVLGAAYDAARGSAGVPVGSGFAALVWVSGLATAALTVAYVTRVWLRVFFGTPRSTTASAGHEQSWFERGTLVALAVPTVGLGWLGLQVRGPLLRTVERTLVTGPGDRLGVSALQAGLALGLAAVAIAVVVAVWRRDPSADPARHLGRAGPVLAAGLRVDTAYFRAFVAPLRDRLAVFVGALDTRLVDGAVEGAGIGATRTGALLRRLENGNLQAYATGLAVGVVALAAGVALGVR
jgi:NADH-quinone oxidoreductase subunit L